MRLIDLSGMLISRIDGFGFVVIGNVTIVYSVDAYRPVAGENVVTQMGFKGEIEG